MSVARTTLPLLLVAIPTATCSAPGESDSAQTSRPNVLLVMTDDQGYGDFGHTGNPVLRTPRLDELARSSPRVERFYVSPVCSPTRASLMTGRWHMRTRVVDTWVGRSMMDPDEVTVAELLRDAGYRTGIFGKWHLGDAYPLRPIDQGFDEALVHRGGGLAQPSEPPANDRRYTDPILFHNGEEVRTQGFCTDVYVDAALEFIDESLREDRPFFAYVSTNAPHDPLHDVPVDLYEEIRERDLGPILTGDGSKADSIARIYAMIENIDQNVGRLVDGLEARGVAEDTLVVFLCDNGPWPGRYNAGLQGVKTGVYEGGIRSPLLVRWPGRLSPETVVEPPTAHVDLLPTVLEATGVPLPGEVRIDGRSLLPLLEGRDDDWTERHLVLQAHRGNVPSREHNFAVVGERWKLLRASRFGLPAAEPGWPFKLYDLEQDPGELHDLSETHPEVVAELRDVYAEWFDDVTASRPDPFAPPRIVVGTEHERATVLTRQDWRVDSPGGWGKVGTWMLHLPEARRTEVTLLFRDPTYLDVAVVAVDGSEREVSVEASGETLELGAFDLPAGDIDLRVHGTVDGELVGVHQVVLTADLPGS